MSPSIQQTFGPMELQKVESPLSTALKSLENWRALVPRALRRINWSQKQAALEMGVPEPQFSRQLAGAEHLSFWRMVALPAAFWEELIPMIVEYHGLTLHDSPQQRHDAEIGRLVREAVTRSLAR